MQNLVFIETNSPLLAFYEQLLMRTIDKERRNEAHPAFVKVIEQLSPDEALILWVLQNRGDRIVTSWPNQTNPVEPQFPFGILEFPRQLIDYISHLRAIKLIKLYQVEIPTYSPNYQSVVEKGPGNIPRHVYDTFSASLQAKGFQGTDACRVAGLVSFGRSFGNACIPNTLPDRLNVVEL